MEAINFWIDYTQKILGANAIYGIIGVKKDLYFLEKITEEEGLKIAQSKEMKFKLVSSKTEPSGIKNFIEELFHDYLPTINKNEELISKKSDEKNMQEDNKDNKGNRNKDNKNKDNRDNKNKDNSDNKNKDNKYN